MDVVASIAAELGIPGWSDALGDTERLHEWWTRFYDTVLAEIQASLGEP